MRLENISRNLAQKFANSIKLLTLYPLPNIEKRSKDAPKHHKIRMTISKTQWDVQSRANKNRSATVANYALITGGNLEGKKVG